MKVDKDMVTSFLQIQPDNLIKKAALDAGAADAAAEKKWNRYSLPWYDKNETSLKFIILNCYHLIIVIKNKV